MLSTEIAYDPIHCAARCVEYIQCSLGVRTYALIRSESAQALNADCCLAGSDKVSVLHAAVDALTFLLQLEQGWQKSQCAFTSAWILSTMSATLHRYLPNQLSGDAVAFEA